MVSSETTLKYIEKKFGVDLKQELPIKLPMDRLRGLTNLFRELGYKVGVEIGVRRGLYSKWIIVKSKCEKLYCIDPWCTYDGYVEHKKDQMFFNGTYEQTLYRLSKWIGNKVEIVKKPSMSAVKDFMDNSLDFVFIDGNHTFEYAINDIAEWEKKVKPGGIISGHDYWNSYKKDKYYANNLTEKDKIKLVQVKDAVDGWTNTNKIKPWFVTKDLCWFWAKQ